ncbi:multiple epidermal growth factor-like domains protein 10 [Saccostrea cucullata]|uniref:multiple epidermal growth factor-like domains protein 10 n=1 Tax=Saccostrea cuccullata TaxID=36930 RepID=UPI002ED1EAE5
MDDTFIILFALCLGIYTLVKGDCNNTHPDQSGRLNCCTNFYIYNGECRECPAGFFGENCSRQCGYPFYGTLCQNKCQCDNITCDRVMGCIKITSTDAAKEILPMKIPSPESNYSTSQEETRNGDTSIKSNLDKTFIINSLISMNSLIYS